MFILKKILTPFLIPPGLFITLLIISGIWLLIRKYGKAGILNLLLGIIIWISSISPVSDFMMRKLEADLIIPKHPKGDVIILLGGGVYDNVYDLSGAGFPSPDSLGRVVTTARLQKLLKTPVIVSAGQVYSHGSAEAPINKRILVDLGVPADKIISEAKSRDTIENARYSKQICKKLGFKMPIVVTSAYHMKRSILSFQKVDMDIIPYPANFKTWKNRKYHREDYLPGMLELETSSMAMHEYLGLVFYKWAY